MRYKTIALGEKTEIKKIKVFTKTFLAIKNAIQGFIMKAKLFLKQVKATKKVKKTADQLFTELKAALNEKGITDPLAQDEFIIERFLSEASKDSITQNNFKKLATKAYDSILADIQDYQSGKIDKFVLQKNMINKLIDIGIPQVIAWQVIDAGPNKRLPDNAIETYWKMLIDFGQDQGPVNINILKTQLYHDEVSRIIENLLVKKGRKYYFKSMTVAEVNAFANLNLNEESVKPFMSYYQKCHENLQVKIDALNKVVGSGDTRKILVIVGYGAGNAVPEDIIKIWGMNISQDLSELGYEELTKKSILAATANLGSTFLVEDVKKTIFFEMQDPKKAEKLKKVGINIYAIAPFENTIHQIPIYVEGPEAEKIRDQFIDMQKQGKTSHHDNILGTFHFLFPHGNRKKLEMLINTGNLFTSMVAQATSGVDLKQIKKNSEAQLVKMAKTFAAGFSEDLLDQFQKTGKLFLEGKNERRTIFFMDIKGFSSISEAFSNVKTYQDLNGEKTGRMAKIFMDYLNDFYYAVQEIIKNHEGQVNQIIGDAVMVPFEVDDQKQIKVNALKAAIQIQQDIARIQKKLKRKYAEALTIVKANNPNIDLDFKVRIGIKTGDVIIGSVGSKTGKNVPTAIGRNVNEAQRLEAMGKDYDYTGIIIDEETKKLADKGMDQIIFKKDLEQSWSKLSKLPFIKMHPNDQSKALIPQKLTKEDIEILKLKNISKDDIKAIQNAPTRKVMYRNLPPTRTVGSEEFQPMYIVVGYEDELLPDEKQITLLHNNGINQLLAKKTKDASRLFLKIKKISAGDKIATHFQETIKSILENEKKYESLSNFLGKKYYFDALITLFDMLIGNLKSEFAEKIYNYVKTPVTGKEKTRVDSEKFMILKYQIPHIIEAFENRDKEQLDKVSKRLSINIRGHRLKKLIIKIFNNNELYKFSTIAKILHQIDPVRFDIFKTCYSDLYQHLDHPSLKPVVIKRIIGEYASNNEEAKEILMLIMDIKKQKGLKDFNLMLSFLDNERFHTLKQILSDCTSAFLEDNKNLIINTLSAAFDTDINGYELGLFLKKAYEAKKNLLRVDITDIFTQKKK